MAQADIHSPELSGKSETLPDDIFTQHLGILGKTGSGKTTAAKGFAERLIGVGRRVCAIDPTGVWWGLRLLSDGIQAGYPVVIFGGNHADVPLDDKAGERLAEIIAGGGFSCVIDTSLMTVGARTRLFTDFAEALFRANRKPLHLIIDEDPQSGRMLHAANNLVSGGRSRGLRIMLISQRPAKLHKDSLTQVETLIAMRLIAPQDRAAVEAWIGEWADEKQGREIINSLPSLARGVGWVWSPEIGMLERVSFPGLPKMASLSARLLTWPRSISSRFAPPSS
jgi:DNA helicase HerA-like ATPase